MPQHTPKSHPSASGDGSTLVRINKALAQAGVCSRRAADDLVARGLVTVNGEPAQAGIKVDPTRDRIEVRGKSIASSPAEKGHAYVLLHKPTSVVTTARDPQGRKTVLDILPGELKKSRIYPVGRLDFFSEGLLILTDDGELANRLTHPRWHLPKVYRATVRGRVGQRQLAAMRDGMTLAEGERLAPVKAEIVGTVGDTATLELTLMQGVNRQIRRMCRDLGLTVLRLARVSQGPLTLAGLRPGQARALTPEEVHSLRKAVGLK